jgi:Bacterial Ig-like domain (group 4)./F5/8 type C domain.
MDDWLRLEDNGLTTDDQKATAARMNYAAKLANLTAINSGQIDSDAENIGAIAWTYQSEMGNLGAQGTGEGSLHNGWRQMAGEADLGLFGALQVLSSDVAIDPVFGLFGYGCDVSDNGSTYKVTPLDGLFTRLNFINQKLYVELDRDQYTDAEVAKDNTSIQLTMKNLEKTKHNTDVNITGLAPGTYQVSVGSSVTGSFNVASANTASTITIPLPAAETAAVSIVKGSALPNTAPVLTLAPTKTVELSDVTRLEAKATDDGYVNSTLTYKWEISSAPTGGNATIANADKPITNVTFDKAGEYVFKLTANDGGMSTSKDITVTVKENSVLPKDLVNYTFDKDTIVGTNKLYAKSDNKFDGAEVDNHTQFVPGKDGNGVKYTGKIAGGYIELPETITKNLDTATISMDVNLSETQSNRTTLFEFGKNVVVEFVNNTDYVNSNELEMTVNGKTASTGVELASGYWKNVELTVNGDDYTLYVNGVKKAELQDTSLKLSDIKTDAERYLIGRSSEEAEPFLKGVIDNFVVKSYVMSAAQLKSAYGISGTPSPVSAKACSVVTSAGNTPALPEKVSVLYSDGVYVKQAVTWDSISASKYAQDGSFTVSGKVTGTDVKASANVRVVSGTTENIAASAKASAIINTPDDLGGTDGLNDGFEPTGAEDTSHGVWHNWKGGNLQGAAWIQYNWDKEQVINGVDLYFFKNDAGNFDPESYIIEYQNAEGEWFPVSGANGLGVKINQYNATSFNPVATKAIRVTMLPAHDGIGVIEWKVYGYKAASDGSGSSSGSGGTDVNPPALAPQIQEAKTKESPADIQKGKASIKVDVDSQNLLDAAKKGKVNAELTVPDQQLVQQLADKSVKQVALDLVVPSAVLNNENISLSKIILPKSVLEGAKKAKKNLTVTVKDENNQIEASWTFTGKELAKSVTPLSDIDLAIIVGTEQDNDSIKKVVTKDKKNDKAVVIQFAHQETLPADAKVTVSLKGTHLQSGNGAYLYSYNSSTGKYKEVVGPKYKVDKSGNVTFEIGQGAQYVLLTARPDAAVTDRLVDGVVVPEAQKVPAGGTAKVKVTVPESAPAKITYKVDNRSLAKVDKNGKITAKGNGTVTLTTTVTIQGSAKTFVTKVTVKK